MCVCVTFPGSLGLESSENHPPYRQLLCLPYTEPEPLCKRGIERPALLQSFSARTPISQPFKCTFRTSDQVGYQHENNNNNVVTKMMIMIVNTLSSVTENAFSYFDFQNKATKCPCVHVNCTKFDYIICIYIGLPCFMKTIGLS